MASSCQRVSTSLSSTEPSAPQWKYDVFLSFRGEETRKGIAFELYDGLKNRGGIKTFMDDQELQVRTPISPSLPRAIEESRFAIIVLSRNYASSSWCLEELTKIVDCMKDENRILPLFYHVEPSDVRHQKRSFEVAFTEHEEKSRDEIEKLKKWIDALKTVANFSGWHTQNYKLSSSSNTWYSSGDTRQSYAEVLAGTSEAHGTRSSHLSQMVLESLFKISKRSPEKREPRTVNRKDVVDELQGSLGPEFDVAKGAEYDGYRRTAKQHWDSMTSCYQKAATAYSNRSPEYAGYLSEQAKVKAKMAREAEEKASQEIFRARNKDKGIENDVITIDLHGQHVKHAMKLLKIHLLYGTNAQSLRLLRVITGCGAGKSNLKQSVINLVQNEGIKWSEENPGAVLIKLASQRDYFRFMDREVYAT